MRDRVPVDAPALLTVAHPDDETIALGGSLTLLRRLTLVHVTDGAPVNLSDAWAAGFETTEEYAAGRRCEVQNALEAAESAPRLVALGVRDQEASWRVAEIADALRGMLADVALVITHAYEGGHPDHDACALAVHLACQSMPVRPALLEFSAYHAGPDDGWAAQSFLPNGDAGTTLTLDALAMARRRAALGCFVSQRETLAQFDAAREVLRIAPDYDFTEPPHQGALLYERYDWGITGAQWRDMAVRILREHTHPTFLEGEGSQEGSIR